MSEGWRQHTTAELISLGTLEIGDGYRAKNSEMGTEGLPFIRAGDVNGRVNTIGTDILSKESVSKAGSKISAPGDVVITTKGTVGRLAFVRKDDPTFVYSPQLCYWRSRDTKKLQPGWLFYALQSEEFLHQMRWSAGQTDMAPYMSLTDQRTFFKLTIPPLPEQRAIAATLGALDDKIEVNRRMNEALEAMARALFRDWFVDFGPTRAKMAGTTPYLSPDLWSLFPNSLDDAGKPEGWEADTLGAIATARTEGVDPATVSETTPYIGLEHMPRGSIALSEWEGAAKVSSNKGAFEAGDFLFGKLRPYFHKVGVAPVSGICSTDIVVVRPSAPSWRGFVIACISDADFVAYTDKTSTGTKMPRTSWRIMSKYPATLPSIGAVEAFDALVAPMLGRIRANILESRTLAQTRDLLLPRLMSGELRVTDAARAVEAVL